MKKKTTFTILGILALAGTWVGCQATRAGYESAGYTVVESEIPGVELRKYPELVVVGTKSEDDSGRDGSFMRLFRYIDKGNAEGKKIAMTTPVLMADGDMNFVVPKEVVDAGTPEPTDETVDVKTLPAGLIAAMRFKDRKEAPKEAGVLKAKLTEAGKQVVGAPLFAYYDPPWTPKALRRNEVLFRLQE